MTLAAAGTYLITCIWEVIEDGTGDENRLMGGLLLVDGTEEVGRARLRLFDLQRATVSQSWVVTTAAAGVDAECQARKDGGTGTSSVFGLGGGGFGNDSRIIAIGP